MDAAIDRAVREMLDVEAPANLRARVIRSIESPAHVASGFSWKTPKILWLGAPLAAAAALILAVVLQRQPQTTRPVNVAVTTPAESPRSAPPAAEPPRTQPRTAPTNVAAVRRTATTRPSRVIAAAVVTADDGVPKIRPLGDIAPIAIAPIAQRSIAPAEIAIAPLDPISELQVAPLNPPVRRN